MTETKEQRNARVQARWDDLTAEGKHGHYETLFRVVREEVERERETCAKIADDYARIAAMSDQPHAWLREDMAELIAADIRQMSKNTAANPA